ncbi:MAG: hypothetical protein BJ554DRAFT_4759 [Olpidium bornovanus]|uniref:Uncharacterized protein n=1 Tax=Olpidium bornovanus TaxID=278681 RepID=A0A8H8DM68_9FUNG|nr:MAG: hypothetical protein BJ554DRAFT_4759 [Olpidium bornovanus]
MVIPCNREQGGKTEVRRKVGQEVGGSRCHRDEEGDLLRRGMSADETRPPPRARYDHGDCAGPENALSENRFQPPGQPNAEGPGPAPQESEGCLFSGMKARPDVPGEGSRQQGCPGHPGNRQSDGVGGQLGGKTGGHCCRAYGSSATPPLKADSEQEKGDRSDGLLEKKREEKTVRIASCWFPTRRRRRARVGCGLLISVGAVRVWVLMLGFGRRRRERCVGVGRLAVDAGNAALTQAGGRRRELLCAARSLGVWSPLVKMSAMLWREVIDSGVSLNCVSASPT